MSSKDGINRWRYITAEELAKHNDVSKNDAWMSIKGVVYDVSSYAAKHPGGIGKIEKYAGKDATDTFNIVHAYVDYEAILKEKQVGILKGHPDAPKRNICTRLKESCALSGSRYKPPSTYFKQDSIIATYVIEFSHQCFDFEWTVGITEKQYLHIYKCIGVRKAWLSVYELPEKMESDQININFKNNYKHIEINLRKPLPTTLWAQQTHGIRNNGRLVQSTEPHSKFDAYIISKKCLTPNLLLFGIQIVSSARMAVPLGFHVELHHGGVSRPYTPVCLVLMDKVQPLRTAQAREKKRNEEVPNTVLYFMIKIYPNGALTQLLDKIPLDEGKEIPTLQVSTPHGYFDAAFLKDFNILFLISAGSGITPMIKILQWFWHLHERLRAKRIILWHFCQKEYDLIWKQQFHELEDETVWFNYFPVLTQVGHNSNWTGARGRISSDMITNCLSNLNLDIKGLRKTCICGPPGFNSSAVSSLAGWVLSENMHIFSN